MTTMLQPAVLDTAIDVRPATVARLELELDTALESLEQRLLEAPQPDDIAMALFRRSQDVHDEFVAALSLVREGTYGVCGACRLPISEDRLEVMPHTRYCTSCAHRTGKETI